MDIYMRSIEEPLDKRTLKDQTVGLQDSGSRCRLTISDVGIEMMTALVGRAMAPSLRRAVAPSLYETLHGQMSSWGSGQGDLLTEVYGEVLGPLIAYFHQRTYPEIIRLVATKNVTCPDLLLFDPQEEKAMLLECKATYLELDKVVEDPYWLDVCDKLRNCRYRGEGQLAWPDQNTVWTAGVSIRGLQRSAGLPIPAFEEAVVASAIPDGRIRTYAGDIQPPRHKGCPLSCDIQCLFDDTNPYITSVLHTRSKPSNIGVTAEWKQFLEWYKAAERALWGRASYCFGEICSTMLHCLDEIEEDPMATPIIMGPIFAALETGLSFDLERVLFAARETGWRSLQTAVSHIERTNKPARPVETRTITALELHDRVLTLFHDGADEQTSPVGNWLLDEVWPDGARGTPLEVNVRRLSDGSLEMLVVPCEPPSANAQVHMHRAILGILGGDAFAGKQHQPRFEREFATWADMDGDERQTEFFIGSRLDSQSWWETWPDCLAGRPLSHTMSLLEYLTRGEAFITCDAKGLIRVPVPSDE